MNQPYGEQAGEPTTRFGEPYRADQPYTGQGGYGEPGYGGQGDYPTQAFPAQGYEPQGYEQQGYPPQGGPPPGRPQNHPPRGGQQPNRRYAAANAYGAPIDSGAKFGVIGTTVAGIGAVLLIVALTAVTWISRGGVSLSFGQVHSRVGADAAAASGMAGSYFSWLAWTLTIVTVIVAVAANLPSPAAGPLRALGAVLAAAAIAFTFLSIRLYTGRSYSDYISGASVGFYLAVLGFLLVGIGALIGPKRY